MHPTSQLCHSPLRLPEKHCMPWPTPQHGLNIQPPFPFSSRHALTLYMHSPPQASLYVIPYVCVCVRKCFACAPYSISFVPPSCSCETGRKASIILMTITTCISICWPQMSRRAAVRLDSESAPKERRKQRQETLGPVSGDPLPTQGPALSTPAHSRLQRHTDDREGGCVRIVAASSGAVSLLLSLLRCL